MKLVSVLLIALFISFAAQAGGPKRDGFLKSNGDAVLTLTSTGLAGHCYALVSKEGKVDFSFEAPKMTINGKDVVTLAGKIQSQTSNKGYELTGTDVSGTPFKIKAKKWQVLEFCANDGSVAASTGYTIVLTVGTKTGSIEVPAVK
jgi:hypothetical protein